MSVKTVSGTTYFLLFHFCLSPEKVYQLCKLLVTYFLFYSDNKVPTPIPKCYQHFGFLEISNVLLQILFELNNLISVSSVGRF